MSQHFSHRTQQQSKDIHSIKASSKELLEDALKSHELKVDHTEFYDYILDAANVSILNYSNSDQMIIKYDKYGLHALAQQDKNSQNNKWILVKFFPKHYSYVQPKKEKKKKKYKYLKTRSNDGIQRSYIPMCNVESGINRVQGYIDVNRTITDQIIPNRIMETHITDIYQYMDKMIALQKNIVINEKIWILCFNYHCKKTRESLYCIAVKIKDPENNRNFIWRLRPVLYTANDILNSWKITEQHLPTTVVSSSEPQQHIIRIKRILSDPNQRNKIFSTKKSWKNVNIFINEKQKNREERKLGIRKEKFLKACDDVVHMSNDINLLPILLFNEFGYSIDALLRVRIHDELDVGISFALSQKNTTVKPTGIHISLPEMMVHCQLINTKQRIGDFFNVWVSKYNNLYVGDPNAQTARYNRKVQDCEVLQDEIKQLRDEIKRLQDELKRHESMGNSQILHSDETKKTDGIHSKGNNDNSDEKSAKIEKDNDISHSELNPDAPSFVFFGKLAAVPETNELGNLNDDKINSMDDKC